MSPNSNQIAMCSPLYRWRKLHFSFVGCRKTKKVGNSWSNSPVHICHQPMCTAGTQNEKPLQCTLHSLLITFYSNHNSLQLVCLRIAVLFILAPILNRRTLFCRTGFLNLPSLLLSISELKPHYNLIVRV